jgi:predicted transcriptional regulator
MDHTMPRLVAVRISDELDRAISAQAETTGRTSADVMRDAMHDALGLPPHVDGRTLRHKKDPRQGER